MAQQIPPARDPGRGPGRDSGSDAADSETPSVPDPRSASILGAPSTVPSPRPGRAPFAWQHGNRLLLLEAGPFGWVLAELRFDPRACRYVEVRRASYRWAREATGALLSRALAEGDAGVDRADRDLQAWLVAL